MVQTIIKLILLQNRQLQKMNFKIQQTYPSPVLGLNSSNTLTYAKHINSLILYGQQKNQAQIQGEQPKKKIAFKVDKSSVPATTDKISIFSLSQRKWILKQATGKIPSARTDFKTVYMHPCVILYGGKCNGKLVNQVFALNCENWVWKKLFSLDGPPTGQEFSFFKITQHTAGLVVANSLWLLQLVDVKWELSANQLPGSVWQKFNVPLPENVKFCWPLNQEILLVIGEKSTYQISLQKKQKIGQLDFSLQKIVSPNEKQLKNLSCFSDPKIGLQLSQPCLGYSFGISPNWINLLKLSERPTKITFEDKKQNNYKILLQRSLKCCAYVPIEEGENPNSSYIFYLDAKGQLISVQMSLVLDQDLDSNVDVEQPSTVRKIISQHQIQSNSCIEEEENQDSSVLIQHSNSRVNIQKQAKAQNFPYFNDNENDDFDNDGYLIDSRVVENQKKEIVQKNANKLPQQKMISREQPIQKTKFERLQQDMSEQQFQAGKQKKKNQQTSRKNMYNLSVSHSNPIQLQKNRQISLINEKIKHKTEEYIEQKKQERQLNEINPSESILKNKLENIMCNEIIRRKLLESKVQALQNIIKKSEKFVLMLCKYGNQADKQKHIEKVKELRQELEWNWNKEIYYRKQMEMNKMPSVVSQQIQQTMQHIQY